MKADDMKETHMHAGGGGGGGGSTLHEILLINSLATELNILLTHSSCIRAAVVSSELQKPQSECVHFITAGGNTCRTLQRVRWIKSLTNCFSQIVQHVHNKHQQLRSTPWRLPGGTLLSSQVEHRPVQSSWSSSKFSSVWSSLGCRVLNVWSHLTCFDWFNCPIWAELNDYDRMHQLF